MSFKLNNDLKNIVFSRHNKFHFWVALILSSSIGLYSSPEVGFIVSYGLWIAWEIGDGFKPWYTDFKYDEFQPNWMNWVRENFFYSDGFSLQDVIIFDFFGALLGTGITTLIL